jgi:hypothetical protein
VRCRGGQGCFSAAYLLLRKRLMSITMPEVMRIVIIASRVLNGYTVLNAFEKEKVAGYQGFN